MNGLDTDKKVVRTKKTKGYSDPIGSLLLPVEDDEDFVSFVPQPKVIKPRKKTVTTKLIVNQSVPDVPKPKTKKDEMLEGLKYLKSKPNKTKGDRESIYTLEMLLKNMS